MKILMLITILMLVSILISGCINEQRDSNISNDLENIQYSESPEAQATATQEVQNDLDEILKIRKNYKLELNDWQKTKCYTDSYTDDLKLDLKITNNNEDKILEYLTIRVNQYDSSGELIGWGRTSIKVRTLVPQTSDYALPCIKGALFETTKVTVEIEDNPPEETYKFHKELQSI